MLSLPLVCCSSPVQPLPGITANGIHVNKIATNGVQLNRIVSKKVRNGALAGGLGVDTGRPDLIGSTELVGVELPH